MFYVSKAILQSKLLSYKSWSHEHYIPYRDGEVFQKTRLPTIQQFEVVMMEVTTYHASARGGSFDLLF